MLNRYPLISLAGGSYVICEQPSRKWIAQCPFVELDLRVASGENHESWKDGNATELREDRTKCAVCES